MPSKLKAQMFRSLVAQVGGVDAACAAIEAAEGEPCSKGTISKIQSGILHVPQEWVEALEDATGNFCFTNHRIRALKGTPGGQAVCLYALAGETSKETGEAVSWGIRAEQSGDRCDHARAAVEFQEAGEKCFEAARIHEARAGAAPTPIKGRGAA